MSDKKSLEINWQDGDADFDEIPKDSSEEFASMLDSPSSGGAVQARQDLRPGSKVSGTIMRISDDSDDVLVDLGGKDAGIIEKRETLTPEGKLRFKKGDNIECYVIVRSHDEILLSFEKTTSLKTIDDLRRAYQDKIAVKGKVLKVNKGGFEVSIMGKSAFCPVSQIDIRFVEVPAEFIGQELDFRIEKLDGRNIVVSRSALLREKAAEKVKEIMKLPPDKILDGKVTRLAEFGAFVDIGGVEGLVHVSQIGFARVNKASDVLKVGERVRVTILKVDVASTPAKISLSMKSTQQDPWDSVQEDFKVGDSYPGTVMRIIKSGCFVELKPGIDGYLHVSEMSWKKRIHDPSEVVKEGDLVTVAIRDIDPIKRRIGLSLKAKEEDPWRQVEAKFVKGTSHAGVVERLKGFGAIVKLAEGIEGMLPVSVLKQKFGDGFRKASSPGKDIEVMIGSVDLASRRIQLTFADLDSDEAARQDYIEYLKSEGLQTDETGQPSAAKPATKPTSSGGIGAFGKLLEAQMKKSGVTFKE